MNFKKIEKSLIQSTIQVVTELNLYTQSKCDIDKGKIYTLYRDIDNRIKIGFTPNPQQLLGSDENFGYRLIDKREGTQNEYKVLKETLLELGYRESNYQSFLLTSELMKYLDMLGWPTGENVYKRKIKKSLYK